MVFEEIINDNKFKRIVSFFDLFSFFLANSIIFLLINYFYDFKVFGIENILISFIFFVFGLILNLMILKTEFFIDFRKNKTENLGIVDVDFKEKSEEKINNEKNKKDFNLGRLNLIVISLRLFFFNILKDLFLVLIVWLVFLLLIFYFTNFLFLQSNYSFTNFVNLVTIIGVISGIFSFYLSSYKEQISKKILDSLNKYFIKIMKKVSLENLEIYLKEKKINLDSKSKKYNHHEQFRIASKYILNIYPNIDRNSQLLQKINSDESIKNELEKFFKIKDEEIKQEIDSMNLKDLRKILLPNIIFFNDIIVEILKSQLEFDFDEFEKKEPEKYEDYLKKFVYENIYYFIEKILSNG